MREADFLVDIGPGAGVNGGEVVAQGSLQDIEGCARSITGQYLCGVKKIEVPATRRKGSGKFLEVKGAAQNNLKDVNVKIPLGTFTCVTGVSGSGKSSLVVEIIEKELSARLNRAKPILEYVPGWHCDISGCRRPEDLPQAAADYVRYLEKLVGCRIRYLSVGPEREQYLEW